MSKMRTTKNDLFILLVVMNMLMYNDYEDYCEITINQKSIKLLCFN